jgi:glutathione reductase (NADPH)
VTAERVVIATGSRPARPPIEGIEHALTSTELLNRAERPDRLVVIGGGMIGMEPQVTVFQSGPHVLPALDDEMREALVGVAREAGLAIQTAAAVCRITPDHVVEAEVGGESRRFPADVVLTAVGRPPNIAALNLEAAGVAVEDGAVKVNEFRQSTSAPHVYAAGDATGRHQHTPVAWYEGRVAAENALKGNHEAVDYTLLPTTVFTIPALAQVGLTEREARRRGLRVAVNRARFADNGAADVRNETEGLVKVLYEEASDRILGVHVLGPGAEDLIHIAAAAMRGGLTRQDVSRMHYVFPTVSGLVFDAMWG